MTWLSGGTQVAVQGPVMTKPLSFAFFGACGWISNELGGRMQERNARPDEYQPPTPNIPDSDESPAEMAFMESEVNAESARNVETWSDGFVKPDGTHIQLFFPRATAA